MTTSESRQLLVVFPCGPDGPALEIASHLMETLHLTVVDIGLDPVTENVEVRLIASDATEERLILYCLERSIHVTTSWIGT